MLGAFQRIFPEWQLPKSVLAAVIAPPQPVLAAALGPLAHPCRSAWLPIAACGASEGLFHEDFIRSKLHSHWALGTVKGLIPSDFFLEFLMNLQKCWIG